MSVGLVFSVVFCCTFAVQVFSQCRCPSTPFNSTGPRIQTLKGIIEGDLDCSYFKRPFMKFLGIPYAEPPIKDLRFEPPEDVEPWCDIYKANRLTRCLHLRHDPATPGGKQTGSEDCLHLSVFVPRVTTKDIETQQLNIVVYLNGQFSSQGIVAPYFIMDRELVLVTVNYRLGVFGYFCAENSQYPGNIALRDQIKALEWIKENIHFFGGNPNNILLAGVSDAAASAHILTLSPRSRELFHKVHAMSGSALQMMQTDPKNKFKCLARHLGCNLQSTSGLVECLKRRPAGRLVRAERTFRTWLFNPISPFSPVVDKWSSNPVLPKEPLKLFEERRVENVPLLMSFTSSEGLYPTAELLKPEEFQDILRDVNVEWFRTTRSLLNLEHLPRFQLYNASRLIRNKYFDENGVSSETFGDIVRMVGDRLYLSHIDLSLRMHANSMEAPVYSYNFDYYSDLLDVANFLSQSDVKHGVCHGADVNLFLPSITTAKRPVLSKRDENVMKFMLDVWEHFLGRGILKDWPPITCGDHPLNVRYIGDVSKQRSSSDLMTDIEELGERTFWQGLNISTRYIEDVSKQKMPWRRIGRANI